MIFVVSYCMSPMMLGYKELGIKLIFLGEDHTHHPKWPPMVDEKIDDIIGDLVKLFLKEAIEGMR